MDPISSRTRSKSEINSDTPTYKRLVKKNDDDYIYHDIDEELSGDEFVQTEAQQSSEEYSDSSFIEDEDKDAKGYTLNEMMQMVDDDDLKRPPVVKTVVSPNGSCVALPMPDDVFELQENFRKYIENEEGLYKEFIDFCKTPRSMWGTTKYYQRLYTSVIKPTMCMGKVGQTQENAKLLEDITNNKVEFVQTLPKPVEIGQNLEYVNYDDDGNISYAVTIEPASKCHGCGIAYRTLVCLFIKTEFRDNSIFRKSMLMGTHCGEKVRSIIEIYKILNGIGFIEKSEWQKNALAMLNYWSRNAVEAIAINQWNVLGDEENDAEDV